MELKELLDEIDGIDDQPVKRFSVCAKNSNTSAVTARSYKKQMKTITAVTIVTAVCCVIRRISVLPPC